MNIKTAARIHVASEKFAACLFWGIFLCFALAIVAAGLTIIVQAMLEVDIRWVPLSFLGGAIACFGVFVLVGVCQEIMNGYLWRQIEEANPDDGDGKNRDGDSEFPLGV